MVMIKLGAPLIDINGKYNGEIYRRDQYGNTLDNRRCNLAILTPDQHKKIHNRI